MPRKAVQRPARKRLDREARRLQLLALGRAAFQSRAYDEVSVEELAEKAGISGGLFYHYFPTKRDLYLASIEQIAAELVNKLGVVTHIADSPRARATQGVEAYLAFVERQPAGFVALMRGGSDPEVASVLERVRVAILDEFLQGAPISKVLQSRPMARIAIRSWIGLVEAASLEWRTSRDVSRDSVRDLLVDSLFDMLGKVLAPKDALRYK
ncbi:MAG: TetR/AcrR family transcriptional regulator [Deltaproteobacteria bacterium]|nr:TetR/AcrR family transcriptional regulator [Deltaproteobacteria bacterium]